MIDKQIFSQMQFIYPWRKYQSIILEKFTAEALRKQNKVHIVSPPGSGKTIVGIELIKRLDQPAVIFSPTSTIQLQWKEKTKLFFTSELQPHVTDLVSKDPKNLKLINTFTYQLVSSPSENQDFIEEVAKQKWIETMLKQNLVENEEQAVQRINTQYHNNRANYNKNISKYYKQQKKLLLTDKNFDINQILHPNAQKLISDLVKIGVKTVILDESHHLLDYWAIVIHALLKAIGDYTLIGLTATPPIGATNGEQENYYSLLGDIDFEVPTPAVVKEGNLAPYQDLVYFVRPTESERKFIYNIQNHFEEFIKRILAEQKFSDWLHSINWQVTSHDNAPLAISAMRFFNYKKVKLPIGLPQFEEGFKEIALDDWVALLKEYSLNYLTISADPYDQLLFKEIKVVLKQLGFTLTEEGLRSYRSPADRVLSLSAAKTQACITILTEEMKSLGTDLRALVITDFEYESAYSKENLQGVIDSKSGGAVQNFVQIVHDPTTTKLEAILVTGSQLLIDHDEEKYLMEEMLNWQKESGLIFELEAVDSQYPHIRQINGKGKDWKSNTYVRMVTSLFERGVTKCIVGTRGLLAEGWDTLTLNTIIDLTSATTSTTVQQIRGRSIRLNPDQQQKISNNWDIVCIEPKFEKGDQDFTRFIKKHSRFYGLGDGTDIVRGIGHVDKQMFFEYLSTGFKALGFNLINQRQIAKARDRAKAYKNWKIGDPYNNIFFHTTQLQPKDIKFKTIATFREVWKAILNALILKIGATAFACLYFIFQTGILEIANGIVILCVILLVAFIIFISALSDIYKAIKHGFIELPIDSYIKDMAKAVLAGLKSNQLIDRSISLDDIRVQYSPEGYLDVFLDYASQIDTDTFNKSFNQLFEPIIDQRYLVERSEAHMKLGLFTPLWFTLRKAYGMLFEQDKVAYHPVPAIFAVNKNRAKIFVQYWQQFVGGNRLIYTRSYEGAKALLQQRTKTFQRVRRVQLDLWK